MDLKLTLVAVVDVVCCNQPKPQLVCKLTQYGIYKPGNRQRGIDQLDVKAASSKNIEILSSYSQRRRVFSLPDQPHELSSLASREDGDILTMFKKALLSHSRILSFTSRKTIRQHPAEVGVSVPVQSYQHQMMPVFQNDFST